jgi:hypothetical protein
VTIKSLENHLAQTFEALLAYVHPQRTGFATDISVLAGFRPFAFHTVASAATKASN